MSRIRNILNDVQISSPELFVHVKVATICISKQGAHTGGEEKAAQSCQTARLRSVWSLSGY
jgi:hypothetical protein